MTTDTEILVEYLIQLPGSPHVRVFGRNRGRQSEAWDFNLPDEEDNLAEIITRKFGRVGYLLVENRHQKRRRVRIFQADLDMSKDSLVIRQFSWLAVAGWIPLLALRDFVKNTDLPAGPSEDYSCSLFGAPFF